MVKIVSKWPKCFGYEGYETFRVVGDIEFDNDENSANCGCVVFKSAGRGYAIPFNRVVRIERMDD